MAKAPGRRVEVGGEEFEIEDPRTRRVRQKPTTLLEPAAENDGVDAPPTQAERLDAIKALFQMEQTVKEMFKKLGGHGGTRATSIAITHVEDAFLRARDYAATTKRPWR